MPGFTFERPTGDDLYNYLAATVIVPLRGALERAGEGQRLRVTTLPGPVMERVCHELQNSDRWQARLLSTNPSEIAWQVSATKIIELRNVLKEPLLVFIPPGLRTAAEDSLDIATFTELSLANSSNALTSQLLERIDKSIRPLVSDLLEYLRLEKISRNDDDDTAFLLATLKNGGTAAAAGAALCSVGLVPDFDLLGAGNIRARTSRNIRACQILGDLRQPLQTRIRSLAIEHNTIQPALFSFLRQRSAEGVRSWVSNIAYENAHHHLSFDKWLFAEAAEDADDLRIIMEPLDLPRQSEDEVGGAAQLQILNLDGRDPLKISFRSLPPHGQVAAWRSFRIQLLSVENGEVSVTWESNNYKKPAGRTRKVTRKIKVSDLQLLEEGTYYAKVDAFDKDGALLTKARRIDDEDPNSRYENETEWFFVTRGGAEVEAPEPRAVHVSSLIDAWTLLGARGLGGSTKESPQSFKTFTGAWLDPVMAPVRGDVRFRVESVAAGALAVLVPGLLRKFGITALKHPEALGAFAADLSKTRLADIEISKRDIGSAASLAELEPLAQARKTVLDAILQQHCIRSEEPDSPTHLSTVETADLTALKEEIIHYVQAYIEVLQLAKSSANGSKILRALGELDVIHLRWRKSPGDPGRALILGPTHPVRLLWHLQHAIYCQRVLDGWENGLLEVPRWKAFTDLIRRDLLPINIPLVLFDRRGRGYVERGNLTQHWSLYLPDRAENGQALDVSTCRDAARSLLGLKGASSVTTSVGSEDIARRAFDYLVQHPYVEQLKINVFNPGDGEIIADALRVLEQKRLRISPPDSPGLRYSIQLFAGEDNLEQVGEGIESLLDPERQVGEDDEFTLAPENHLLPKLVFSRNTIEEFLAEPKRFTSHISIFHEQFSVHSRVSSIRGMRRGSFVGGLVQETESVFDGGDNNLGWHKGLRPTATPDQTDLGSLLGTALAHCQAGHAASAAATSLNLDVAPVVTLHLDGQSRALLRQVHEVSDWVLTIDRHLGLDYYDSPASSDEAGYLLDFAPEYLQEDRQRIMLTTRSTLELRSLVQPAFDRFGLTLPNGNDVAVVEALRSLSGRLALKLLSAPTHAAEVVGLLLARWLMEHTGLLDQRVVLPFDAHQSWFAKSGEDDNSSEKRADLGLVSFDSATSTVRIRIVEVKFRTKLPAAARSQLYSQMREQSENTERRLRELFDPEFYPLPRADFEVRAKELTTALAFYIRRSQRYGLLGAATADAAMEFVERLDHGYRLEIESTGIVFEQEASGSHLDEDDPGYQVHRFGLDKAQKLVDEAIDDFEQRHPTTTDSGSSSEGTVEPSARSPLKKDSAFDSFRSSAGGASSLQIRRVDTRPPGEDREETDEPKPVGGEESSPPADTPTYEARGTGRAGRASEPPQAPWKSPDNGASGDAPTNGPPEEISSPGEASEPDPESKSESEIVEPQVSTPSDSIEPELIPDVLVGANELTPQYGLIGKFGSAKVAIDLTGCNTVSLFGVQGFGKSYTLGVIAEMATASAAGINVLPAPLATVIFHYHKSDAYAPEYASAVLPNQKRREIDLLLEEYGARPQGLCDVIILAPEAKVEERRREFPGVEVAPIKFASNEIGSEGWKFLLGAYGNESLYIRQLVAIMRRHRQNLTLDIFRQEIQQANLTPSTQRLADDRINLAEPYIDDSTRLSDLLRPGRTVIVDLRDEWIEKDEALGLFVVMLKIFASSKYNGEDFNKLVVFDEAHKYMSESALIGQVVETIREMRHQATSVVIASQDPLSVPRAVVELTSVLILHRMTSPQWLKHLKGAIAAMSNITEAHLGALQPGEALLWAQRSTDKRFTQRPQKIKIRPRFTLHGGGTKTAVSGVTVR